MDLHPGQIQGLFGFDFTEKWLMCKSIHLYCVSGFGNQMEYYCSITTLKVVNKKTFSEDFRLLGHFLAHYQAQKTAFTLHKHTLRANSTVSRKICR